MEFYHAKCRRISFAGEVEEWRSIIRQFRRSKKRNALVRLSLLPPGKSQRERDYQIMTLRKLEQ